MPPTNPSLVERAVDHIREEILVGDLPPGERVHLTETAERLGMSVVPVREALRSLASEGLVVAISQRGYRVSPISVEDLHDTYRLRLLLDPKATELAVPRMTQENHRVLVTAMASLERAYLKGDRALHRVAHRSFHFGIYNACDSPWLIRFIEMLWASSYRYQILSIRRRGTLTDRAEEHRRICDACLEGDGELAALLMRKHLALTLTAVELATADTSALERL
jgi:DNA-binding GntR family transcriptional regulator